MSSVDTRTWNCFESYSFGDRRSDVVDSGGASESEKFAFLLFNHDYDYNLIC